MATVSVRYIVHDVDQAIAFYTEHLGFAEMMHPAPTFAPRPSEAAVCISAARSSKGSADDS